MSSKYRANRFLIEVKRLKLQLADVVGDRTLTLTMKDGSQVTINKNQLSLGTETAYGIWAIANADIDTRDSDGSFGHALDQMCSGVDEQPFQSWEDYQHEYLLTHGKPLPTGVLPENFWDVPDADPIPDDDNNRNEPPADIPFGVHDNGVTVDRATVSAKKSKTQQALDYIANA